MSSSTSLRRKDRAARYRMDHQGDPSAVHGYVDNPVLQHPPRYPGPQNASGYYYPNPYSAYPYQPQNPYPVPGRPPYDGRGNGYPYPCYHSYQPSPQYSASTPVPYPPAPNAPGYYQGTTFTPGFNSSSGYYFQPSPVYQQNQFQYPAEMPVMPSYEAYPNMRAEDHNSRISEANFLQLLRPFAPAPRSFPQSRPLVPTVAPFQPSSTQKDPVMEKQNPLRSEHPSSQIPSLVEPVQAVRLTMEDFPALPKSQASAAPLKEKHATKVMEVPGQGKTVATSLSEGSNIPLPSQDTPAMDTGSRPIKPKQVGAISRVKAIPINETTTVQAAAATNPSASDPSSGSREGPIEPPALVDDGILFAGPARPETGLSLRPAGLHPAPDQASAASEISNTGYAHTHAASAAVRAPPGIECSDERRLQNLIVMESEAEIMDHFTADRVEEWSQMCRHAHKNTPLHRDVEFWRMAPGTNLYGSGPLNPASPSLAFDIEKEYNHILWDPSHRFWDTPSNSRMSPTHILAADPQTQQLVSVFEIACKRLWSYADGYSNFQKPSVFPPTGHRYVEGRIPHHQANFVDLQGIPDWKIAEVRDNHQVHQDFRNNACHVPYMGPPIANCPPPYGDSLRARIPRMDMATPFHPSHHLDHHLQSFSAAPGNSAQIQRGINSPSSYWDSDDYPAPRSLLRSDISVQSHYSAYSDMHNNESTQQSMNSVENPASYYDFVEGPSRAEPPRIMIEAWEPDQTPRPSFASCVISPRSFGSRDCMDIVADSTIIADSILEERPPHPLYAAARDIALARYGTQVPDGSPSPLPRSSNRR
ncbi:hypothetical protein N7481_004534 [Penicillium waksmanii]|uniref:uncharacterized protein n=1 Tax=Penicillium waksmanii TaxID=69791 RepID=UPI0025484001|nr:uncharacterized protein N7481_004534 [Penicillium waksmanii]KAJ5989324.1 hypothetical protein N7481_004534 [Penicillium waksmanii]